MKYYIVIPAHNEADFITETLKSIITQTLLPAKVVIVNDNSTDATARIAKDFCEKHDYITLVHKTSDAIHMPGSKVIEAFNYGYETLDENYDIIVKLDADLILPNNYFEVIMKHFENDNRTGIAGGFAYIEQNGVWVKESLTDNDHVRGAFKAYKKECFLQIGTLKPAMGWDTADELLARYYKWNVVTDSSLQVKHLKPTGKNYSKQARYKQGEAFYALGYGFLITAVASVKLALKKKNPVLFLDYIKGYFKARNSGKPMLVTPQQAKFIRKYRWKKMKEKLF